ncbi:TMEM175 family protein [Deinococcus sp.]|uniref:TMEM175 family protein n=1 Tax=Deinococcus sp. TaxID=47478 RepID=UPI002869B654|nr:TMEM175 family protein [Deinococcus sp.]
MPDTVPPEFKPEFRNAERLKFFTDAVIAIALTLLALPLLESVPEAAREKLTAAEWLEKSNGQLIGFCVSFAVVTNFWVTHHRVYEHVRSYSAALMGLNFAWMFTIVFLQLPSALMYALPTDRTMIALYIGTMLLSSTLLTGMVWYVFRHPELQEPANPQPWGSVATSLASTTLMAAALALALAAPQINYFALFLLMLVGVVRRVFMRGRS